MSTAFVNRERWRADLEELHAGLLGKVGLVHDLVQKTASAELRRAEADAAEELEVLRAAFLAKPSDKRARDDYKAAGRALHEMRRHWRGLGELAGTRRPVVTLNDFSEPTDEELTK
jgi:hypothetical protein